MALIKRYWLIIVLTLIGGGLRLYRIEPSLQFLGDQGRDALVMYRLLTQGDFPFIGPVTSVGNFYLGPLYYYLMAPFLALARFNPAGPAIATAVIGTLTIPALYFVAKKMFGQKAALIAACLYTFGYIPISETRSAWNPNPMPLAVLGILYGFYLNNYKNKPQGLILAGLSLAVALQLHYMIVFLAPWLIWQLVLSWGKPKEKLLTVGIFLLLMAPLLLFELKNNWLNTRGLIEFLTKNKYGHLNLLQVIKDTNGRAEQVIGMVLGFGRDFNLARTWITRIFLFGLGYVLAVKRSRELVMGTVWLVGSIITLAVYQSNIYPHYLGFLFPVVFILAGLMLSQFKKTGWALTAAAIVLFLIFNFRQTRQALAINGNLYQVKVTAAFIKNDIDTNKYEKVNVALLDQTRDYTAMNFRYFLTLLHVPLLNIDQYPQTQTLYVVSPYEQTNLLNEPMWEISAVLPATVSATWQLPNIGNIYKIERL